MAEGTATDTRECLGIRLLPTAEIALAHQADEPRQ